MVAFQHWDQALFIHWAIPPERLRAHLDPRLDVDVFGGRAYLSIIPFAVRGFRARFAPPLPGLSRYLELNLRTYVRWNGQHGVCFFSLDASRSALVLPPWVVGLPYFRARMKRSHLGGDLRFESRRVLTRHPASFRCHWRVGASRPFAEPGSLDHFLVERRALFSVAPTGALLRIDIRHEMWPLREVELVELEETLSAAAGLPGPAEEVLLHYSPGVHAAITAPVVVASAARAEREEHARVSP